MTDNIYTDAAQHDAVIAARAKERLAQIMPDTTQKADERFMAWRQLAQAERRIAELEADVKRLDNLARYFMDGYWERVYIGIPYMRLTVTITDEQLESLRSELKGQG